MQKYHILTNGSFPFFFGLFELWLVQSLFDDIYSTSGHNNSNSCDKTYFSHFQTIHDYVENFDGIKQLLKTLEG